MNWFEFNGIFKICLRRNEWDIVWFQHLIMKNATEKELHWLMTMNWSWWWIARAVKQSHAFGTRCQEAEHSPTNRKGRRFDRCSLWFESEMFFFFSPHVCSYFLFRHAELVEWNVSRICLVWSKNMLFNLSDEQKMWFFERGLHTRTLPADLWWSSSSSSVWVLLFCCRDELLSIRPGSVTEASAEPLCCSGTLRWI